MFEALVFTLASLHINDNRHYNQFNPGIGVEWNVRGNQLGTGAYLNSSAKLSVYGTVGVEKSFGRFGVGLVGGGVTGYQYPVLPLVFPYARLSLGAWQLRVNVLPSKRPIIGFQLVK